MGEHRRHGNRDGCGADTDTPAKGNSATPVCYPHSHRVTTHHFNTSGLTIQLGPSIICARLLAVTTLDLVVVVASCRFPPFGVSSTFRSACCSPSASITLARTPFFFLPILFGSFFLGLFVFFTSLSGPSVPGSVVCGVPVFDSSHPGW